MVVEIEYPFAQDVRVSEDPLIVELSDGHTIFVSLGWLPRLENRCLEERANWRLIGKGHGIHWPDMDRRHQRGRASGREAVQRKVRRRLKSGFRGEFLVRLSRPIWDARHNSVLRKNNLAVI
ncbi:hypothetical protein Cpar_1030 [Chlorobaculum parvum NCIB 8327]|uniref:DUF2442 domain-containing protein n=1 Tax=Chlorobaculum parvum (strain DSM 263 / NCIMB 8327) TaxID=517417 RepID=B3QND5_CHLP8|nr:DUF2442 domain-containing protein [Chlorobaculum parvum]ACF11438.1 hypothetical protein Cpar_1030 [Chlorobaculum parvum NCIB 8327]